MAYAKGKLCTSWESLPISLDIYNKKNNIMLFLVIESNLSPPNESHCFLSKEYPLKKSLTKIALDDERPSLSFYDDEQINGIPNHHIPFLIKVAMVGHSVWCVLVEEKGSCDIMYNEKRYGGASKVLMEPAIKPLRYVELPTTFRVRE